MWRSASSNGSALRRTTRIDPVDNNAFGVRSAVLGLSAAHAAAWRAIVDRELPGGMVFEDDVIFHNDFCELLPQYWRELPCEPSFVYLGGGMRTKVLSNNVRVHQEGTRRVHTGGDETAVPPWTTHAYYVSAEQAQLLLRRFDAAAAGDRGRRRRRRRRRARATALRRRAHRGEAAGGAAAEAGVGKGVVDC